MPIPNPGAGSVRRIVVHGDFTCPWSYLTWLRTEVLRSDGVEIDWRSVEHDPWHVVGPAEAGDRFPALRAAVDRVQEHLLPGETLPHTLAGFVPFTGAATSAYAEASVAQVAVPVRRLLFEWFWQHGLDLDDARLLRNLLVDEMRRGDSDAELVSLWGYSVDLTGGPITGAGWHTVRDWRDGWHALCAASDGGHVVPVVQVDGQAPVLGVAAVDLVGALLAGRGTDLASTDVDHDPAGVPAA
jgi:hypothetical protein